MSVEQSLYLTRIFLSLSLLVQSFEILVLAKSINTSSPWSWKIIRFDFATWPKVALEALDTIFKSRFNFLIYFQILLILFLNLSISWLWPVLLITTNLLICFRFRGTFNGGSDYITMTVLWGLTLSSLNTSDPFSMKLGLYYIAFQCTSSYFIAGLVKIRNQGWRSGLALKSFLIHSNYLVPKKIKNLSHSEIVIKLGTWVVILWEITFPVVWFIPNISIPSLFIAFTFHLGNYFSFGLNRFVFAWLACYPALIFCTQ